ncbi:HEAT repeat domain-containing protein [Paludisphaera soli]|uniref:HEAT repeat domain-containing protein n=1 Tax=Paludisphaera soli TaxID=2712865 RepID=UPI0013EAD95C|nr:HEAT repeat domain-containing protein [Paludisphaera soli]
MTMRASCADIAELLRRLRAPGSGAPRPDAIADLLAVLCDPEASKSHERAADALREIGPAVEAAIPSLFPLSSDSDPDVRGLLAGALGRLGMASGVTGLIPLLHDPDASVRGCADAALARIARLGSPQASGLIPLLRDADGFVRRSVAYALGEIGPMAAAATPDLVPLLRDQDSRVRGAALEALCKIGSADAAAPLIEALGDPNGHDADRAAESLLAIRPGPEAVPALLAVLEDPEARRDLLTNAAEILGTIEGGPEQAAPILLGRLRDAEGRVRYEYDSAAALGRLPSVVETTVVPMLRSEDAELRELGAIAVEWSRDAGSSVVPDLIRMLGEEEGDYSHAAVCALGSLAGRQVPGVAAAAPRLTALLRMEEYCLSRGDIAEALHAMGAAAAPVVPDLIEVLGDEDPGVRAEAAYVLGGVGPAAALAVPAMCRLLRRGDSVYSIAIALGNVGAAEAVSDLIPHLRHEDEETREYVAEALGKIGPAAAEAVPELLEFLRRECEFAAETAVDALGKIGPAAAPAVPDLIRLLRDRSSEIRWRAADVLGLIGPGAAAAIPELSRMAESDGYGGPRSCAAEALARIGAA